MSRCWLTGASSGIGAALAKGLAAEGAAVAVNYSRSAAQAQQVAILSSLPRRVEPEVVAPLAWRLAFFVPFAIMEPYVGGLSPAQARTWRGNFFKCADATSRPHWASWSPLSSRNFHLPECFGELLLIR